MVTTNSHNLTQTTQATMVVDLCLETVPEGPLPFKQPSPSNIIHVEESSDDDGGGGSEAGPAL